MKSNCEPVQIPERFGKLSLCRITAGENQHETAHQLLEQSVQAYAIHKQLAVRKDKPLLLAYQKYGKPYFVDYPDIYFNLSHCDGLAVCLLSEHRCGVDVEKIRKIRPHVVRRVFSSEEQKLLSVSDNPDQCFTRLWTLKESYVKAIGRGISYPMRTVCFDFQDEKIVSNRTDADFYQTEVSEYIISACVLYSGADTGTVQPADHFSQTK